MQQATLQLSTPSDREIAMSSDFDAPRALVCAVDLRVDVAYRFVWRGPDGNDVGLGGVYREV